MTQHLGWVLKTGGQLGAFCAAPGALVTWLSCWQVTHGGDCEIYVQQQSACKPERSCRMTCHAEITCLLSHLASYLRIATALTLAPGLLVGPQPAARAVRVPGLPGFPTASSFPKPALSAPAAAQLGG